MKQEMDITEPIRKLRSDLKQAAKTMSAEEARYLVDLYYQIQDFRKASGSQIGAIRKNNEPMLLIDWIYGSTERIEKEIKKALDTYTDVEQTGMGAWAKRVVGIGPVLSAGLLAEIDITKVKTAGGIWRFAGLDPTSEWKKKEKRPWNARLKTLCWKIGESFVKVQGNPKDYYGHLLLERKAIEIEKNEKLEFKEQAEHILSTKKIGKDTEAYKHYIQGKLPPGHIHARAKRWAVKIFLAHWFEEAFRNLYHAEPPLPYAVAILGHVHKIEPKSDPVNGQAA